MSSYLRWTVVALVAVFLCPATIRAFSCVVVNSKTCAVAGYQDIFVGQVTSIEHPGGAFKVHL